MTPKFELGRDFCTMYLPPSFIILCLLVQKLSCWQTNKQTDRQTDRQTDKHIDKQTHKQTDVAETIQRSSLRYDVGYLLAIRPTNKVTVLIEMGSVIHLTSGDVVYVAASRAWRQWIVYWASAARTGTRSSPWRSRNDWCSCRCPASCRDHEPGRRNAETLQTYPRDMANT